MAQLLKDNKFLEYCKVLKVSGQSPGDPERRVIEKSFRKLALRTHPDKGGDPVEFRKINEAYKGLISHITKLEIIEEESKLSNESVIIEISKQALPTWVDKLTKCYGKPKTANVANVIFQGPYKQYKSASWQHKSTGPITIVVYEDPEDKVPKLHVRCDQYMIWIQQQKMPLHLHVGRDKQIAFDQWRIMSLAEFGFVSLTPGHTSARHDWKDANTPRTTKAKSKQQAEKEAKEAERRAKEAADLKAKEAAEQAKRDAEEAEELARKKKEDETNRPWWHKYGGSDWNMGETTPPPETEEAVPEDNFPKVFSMTSNSYTKRGLNKSMSNLSKSKCSLNSEEEENRPPAAKKEREQSSNDLGDLNIEKDSKSAKMNESMPNLATNNVSHDEMSKSENDLRTKDTSSSFGAKATSDEVIRNEINIPNDIIKETQVNGDVSNPPDENIPNVTKNDSEDLPSDDVEKKTEKEEISTKAKGARRDLGSVAEKLINKNKIKKIKSKRMGRAKSMPPTATQNEDNTTNEEVTCNDEKVQRNPEQENVKTDKSNIESEVPKMDEHEVPKESDNTEDRVSDTRKSSTTSRKRHLEASADNLNEKQSSYQDESKLEKDSDSPSGGTCEPTAKSKSASNGGETCTEASKPKVTLGEFNNQTICSDSQEMDIADPILPSSCAQSAELSKDLTNDKEQSDMHVDSTAVNKENINNKGDNECSIEQAKTNVLPENMEISSDSVEKEAVQEGQIKDNMSTNLKSEINPRKKHSKSSSNKKCKEKISIAEEEPCQNNDETAFASGQQRPRENNSEMKTDRIKEDNERVTKAADIDDVMIENKNAYNLQHANTTCNDLKINQEAAKDILLQLEDVKKQRCKEAKIKKVDKEKDNESKTNFPQNPNIESRTAKNEPIKINEKSQGQEKKGDDKDETEKIMNGHVKTDKTNDNKKDKVPENLKINNASIRKTEEAHTNCIPKTTNNSKPPQSITPDLPSLNSNCLNGMEKDYDTKVIKEELMSLKEELKRQIVENRAANGDIDTNHSVNGESCTNLDTSLKPKVDVKTTDPEKPSDDSVKSPSTIKPKKKKIVKGKTNKSKKKESTPGRELPSEILTEPPVLTCINQIPETPKPTNLIPSKTEQLEGLGSKVENSVESSTEMKKEASEKIIDHHNCNDVGKETNNENPKVDNVPINNTNTPIQSKETSILKQNHLQCDYVHENLTPDNRKIEKDTKEEPVPETSLKTAQTKFCEDLISQFIQSEVIQNETSLAKEIDSNISSFLQKEGHPEDKVEQSEEVPSQNNTEQQKMNTISPQPIKVSYIVQQSDQDSGTILQRPSAFHPRRNSTANHGGSPKLPRQGKSLDEEDSDHEAESTNYKTARSKSMATVDFNSLPNYNRVPARWQGVQINSFNQTPNKFGGVINEELEDKPVITNPPRKAYSPIKENIPATSGYNELIKSNLTSRQEEFTTKEPTRPNLGNLRHPLSRIEAEAKDTKERLYSPEQKEQRLTGISPATAYQQYTFARSKTSLHLNTYGGINQTNFSQASNDSDNYRNKTVSPPPKLETKQNSKIPDRFLKRMQHAGASANEKLPPSVPSVTPSSASQNEKYVPSHQESALSAKIKQAREEHSNACKDAKSFEKYERFNTVPTISTAPPQRSSAPRTLPSEVSNRLSQQEALNRTPTSRLSTPHGYNSPSSPNLSRNRHTSPLSSSSRARNMTLARSSSPFASGPLADRNARHAERLRIISDRPNIPSRFAHASHSSGTR